ncbi:response regulator transcription factor [Sporomusa sp.]|uniref:response regulator transcription factor n=1 Tax=Sporomusa sp. TaxID=2078658 RepID=UPI002C8003BB|nr:response regulator [Sporomusa sp.]HWR41860.1 response regulator [Sporomusa sp.]
MNNILIVDDEKWVRSALKWTVEQTGLPVKVAGECSNGLEALDWLKTNQVDLVLADITMPVMTGLTFLENLRQAGNEQDVIFITVNEDFCCVQQALRAGAIDYLLKPVEEEQLTACLTKWLTRRNKAAKEQEAGEPLRVTPLSPVEQVLKYIESLPPGQITLAEAAKHVYMNPSYLSQLFKQQQGINFIDYVTQIRLKEAKRLLSSTTLRISEIAERLGYSDLAYFTNIFKKSCQVTPSEYRKTQGRH